VPVAISHNLIPLQRFPVSNTGQGFAEFILSISKCSQWYPVTTTSKQNQKEPDFAFLNSGRDVTVDLMLISSVTKGDTLIKPKVAIKLLRILMTA
jgi:hypothetical protein